MEEKMTFEKAVEGLEKCVDELEEGSLSLEETINRYEEGKKYAKLCYDLLDKAELKIKELQKNGEVKEIETED